MNDSPKVFISYSWEDDDHKDWVRSLADRLISDGIETTLDQYDLSLGDRLPQFMEQSIACADYVLIICTPSYKTKSDSRTGGVGYEGHIISNELFSKHNERKFIPIIRKGPASTAIPNCLAGKMWIDLTESNHYEENYKDLVTTIYGSKRKPSVGQRPEYINSTDLGQQPLYGQNPEEPIHILGIITDEVTMPRLDGTSGSALYKIPFRLSKAPSRLWQELFVREWNGNLFSKMHRPGIASVQGSRIILDGTTIEEVRDYHRQSLKTCVEEANRLEEQALAEKRKQEVLKEQTIRQHNANVSYIARDIVF